MRKVISSLDIGNNSVKLIVGEFTRGRLHILSASKVDNDIFNDKKSESEKIIESIDKVCSQTSQTLGINIKKIILCIGTKNSKLIKATEAIKIKTEDKIISGEHITKLIQKCSENKIPQDYVLVGTQIVNFTIDGNSTVKNPKGKKSENLGIKAILITAPKDYVTGMLDIAAKAGLKVVDVVPSSISDYYCYRNKITKAGAGAIINLGYSKTGISIFDRGLITNAKVYSLGGKNIVNDIANTMNVDEKTAYALFNDLTLASNKLANPKEYRMVEDLDGRKLKVNQYKLSEIASNRITEVLNLTKKQINILTKKKISYIIVTGGLTEMRDFEIALKDSLNDNVTLGKINLIGARDNSYSTVIGSLCFFEEKLDIRDKNFTIFNNSELKELNDGFKTSETLLGKVFGYFFDN